jgi:hypothetical protein
MQVRRIILAVAIVSVLGLVAYLFIQVNSDSSGAEVSAAEKARALAEYERRNKVASADVPAPVARATSRARPAAPAGPDKAEDRTFEKPRRRNNERPARAGLSMSQPAISLSAGGGGDPELKKRMSEVSAAYDTGDYPTAHDLAVKVLEDSPRNIKMLRVVVSTSCSEGDADGARKYATQLPERDRKELAGRCKRWGVDL